MQVWLCRKGWLKFTGDVCVLLRGVSPLYLTERCGMIAVGQVTKDQVEWGAGVGQGGEGCLQGVADRCQGAD